jgi:chitodextrinase
MNTLSFLIVTALCTSLSINATEAQPDPDNPSGYILSKADILASEQSKTLNPMYDIWSKALQTRSNAIVDDILPNSNTNPDNVKRAERVFGLEEWQFLTPMAAPEYTYKYPRISYRTNRY